MQELTQFDKQCFKKAIEAAAETYKAGNYPIGAVLAIDNEIIGIGGNKADLRGPEKMSSVDHAENLLIIKYGNLLNSAYKQNKDISLYSTLEPCIQCLGASVINHIKRILYIERDPNGGACDLKHDNIGQYYKDSWPEIIHCPITSEPKELMIKFFHEEIERGNTEWPERMLKLMKVE